MLHLTIKPGDKIFIGSGDDAIVVSFERKTREGCKLGVNAPREVPVYTVFNDSSEQFKNRRNNNGNS